MKKQNKKNFNSGQKSFYFEDYLETNPKKNKESRGFFYFLESIE